MGTKLLTGVRGYISDPIGPNPSKQAGSKIGKAP